MNVMRTVVVAAGLAAGLGASAAPASAQAPRPPVAAPRAQPTTAAPTAPATSATTDRVAEAYTQFLLAQRFEDDDDADGAIAAYRRAMTLDPKAADIVAELANLYMRQNRTADATTAAENALKIDPKNPQAHLVLGTVYATLASSQDDAQGNASPLARNAQRENLTKAIDNLEQSLANSVGMPDANTRAMLSRLYMNAGQFDKAIPMLSDLVKQEPGWQDGAMLLAQAYQAAGRSGDAVSFLEQAAQENPQLYSTLADFYGRQDRWKDAADAYAAALQVAPRNFDLRVGYGSALLNIGGPDNAMKARDVLREAIAERQRYQAVVDSLAPAVNEFRSAANAQVALGALLPHLGFAYQQVGKADSAIATFEEAQKMAPDDPSIASYLIQANMAAKKYSAAAALAHTARAQHPDDLRLARLEASALRQGGKNDQAIAVLQDVVSKHGDQPAAYIALAQGYSDVNRGPQAVKVLQDAQTKFPDEPIITFELGAVLDKQKKFSDAEAAFRQLIAKDPQNAAALNYLGYMLAERGERLDESVSLLQRALQVDPDNGSYLDSLGWAHYKGGKFDQAADELKRASDQLVSNSVIQDHYGDVLLKLGRYDEAIAAWTRALAGDSDSIDRGNIDKKIRSARQKLPKR